jgi:hypothetical protein
VYPKSRPLIVRGVRANLSRLDLQHGNAAGVIRAKPPPQSQANIYQPPLHLSLFAMNSLLLPLELQVHRLISTPSISGDYTLLFLLHFPFQNPETRADLLAKRWSAYLDDILKTLPSNDSVVDGSKNIDKAREILRQIDPHIPSLCRWKRPWTPPSLPSLTPTQIADDTNAMISTPFKLITFKELVRIACGYESGSGQELFDGISDTRRRLCEYFQTRPEAKELFQQVKHPHCTE